jgi:hypothetical protein
LDFATWHALYHSNLQSVWALLPVPLLFLLHRLLRGRPPDGVLPAAASFVDGYAIVFAIETIIDPFATGPLPRALGIAEGSGGTALLVLFVLLGDFRVYLLIFGLLAIAAGRPWSTAIGTAAAWTTLVPITAYLANAALHAVLPTAGPHSIWPIYEALFAVLALALRARLIAARVPPAQPGLDAYLRAVLLYVARYYALWVAADLLIQIGRLDVGWVLRIAPNQLYYAFWIPFVYVAFFSRWYQSTSSSTQAAR